MMGEIYGYSYIRLKLVIGGGLVTCTLELVTECGVGIVGGLHLEIGLGLELDGWI